MIDGKKAIALIQARCSSARLPKKHFRYIGDKRLIDIVLERLKEIDLFDEIIISTTNDISDKPFIDYALQKDIGVFCYDGDINDVVGRHYNSAKQHNGDYITVISGDCPLIDADLIKIQLKKIHEGYDYVRAKQECIHEGIDTYSSRCFDFLNKNSKSSYERENFGVIIRENPDLINIGFIDIEEKYCNKSFRISVDNMADLRFMNALYKEISSSKKDFTLSNVVELINAKPELKELNAHVLQKKKGEKTFKFLIKTEAGSSLGLGHIRRMTALGKYLNENRNNGVFYAINEDSMAKQVLEEKGHLYDYVVSETEDELINLINGYKADILIVDVKNLSGKTGYDFKNIKKKTNLNKIILIDKYIEDQAVDLFIIQGIQSNKFEKEFKDRKNVIYGMDCVFIGNEFEEAKRKKIFSANDSSKVLVSFGGSDPLNLTTRTIKNLKDANLDKSLKFKIILGPYFSHTSELSRELELFNYDHVVVKNPKSYANELVDVSYGITAYGVSFYELLYIGIPSVVYPYNAQDETIVKKLHREDKAVEYSDPAKNLLKVMSMGMPDFEVGNLDKIYDLIISR